MDPKKSGYDAAMEFLRHAIEAKKIRDELESFGTEDLSRAVSLANKLGYKFGDEDLKKALGQEWGDDKRFVIYFCLSEPPGF